MKNKLRSKARLSPIASVFAGVLFSALSFGVCALIASAVLIALENPTGNIGIVSLIVFLVSGAICGFFISKFRGDGGILSAILSSAASALIIIFVALILCGGNINGGVFMNALCYILISSLFAYFGRKRERHKRKR